MYGISAVEFGSGKCPTCQAFLPVWNNVQKMISISSKEYDIDQKEGKAIMQRDNTAENGVPSIYVYNGDKVLASAWFFDFDSYSPSNNSEEQFPAPEVIAEKVCATVRKNGFPCEVNGLSPTLNAIEVNGSSADVGRPFYSDTLMVIILLVSAMLAMIGVYRHCLRNSTNSRNRSLVMSLSQCAWQSTTQPLDLSFPKTISQVL